jgi:ferredoxin
VREEVCTGCGFCEYACPVVGKSAIVVQGVQPQVFIAQVSPEEFTGERIRNLFSVKIRDCSLRGVDVYEGKDRLYEYIDGGAEVYLSYHFRQVAVATYVPEGGGEIAVEVWEFEKPEDAFGAYSLNRAGTEYSLGDEAFFQGNNLWVWKAKYYLSLVPSSPAIRIEDVISIAESVVGKMALMRYTVPRLLRSLPREGLISSSVKFFHEKIVLDNIEITKKPIEENIFRLGEDTDAVIGEYVIERVPTTKKLLIIKYPSVERAEEAKGAYSSLRRYWGEPFTMLDGLLCFQGEEGFSGVLSEGRYLIVSFMSPDELWAESYIQYTATMLPAE